MPVLTARQDVLDHCCNQGAAGLKADHQEKGAAVSGGYSTADEGRDAVCQC